MIRRKMGIRWSFEFRKKEEFRGGKETEVEVVLPCWVAANRNKE